jgi:hypothetical protein|nr:MAG TPA: hypothetical protein [Caudoviricetes sp.]
MCDVNVEEIIKNDIILISKADIENMENLEARKLWQKHLRMFDGVKVTQKEISDIKKTLFEGVGDEDIYNYNLMQLQMRVTRR